MMENFIKGIVTVFVWVTYLAMLSYSMEALGVTVIGLAFVLMIPVIILSVSMWAGASAFGGSSSSKEGEETNSEKRKRDRIDSVLRDLSDDDLIRLRQRLQNGTINDDVLYDDTEVPIPDA